MSKVFSPRTLGEFEAASASIPLRPLDRAFETANIRLGKDPGGPAGSRRAQFRRYVASVDQHDPKALDRLGNALGALIDEVATSKQDFLVKAAERDGFVYAGGVFRPATAATKDAAEATELLEAACRSVLRLSGGRASGKTAELVAIAKSTLEALEALKS